MSILKRCQKGNGHFSGRNLGKYEKSSIYSILFIYLFFFKFYFIFKLYIIVLVLTNIKMNPPQVYIKEKEA